MPRHEKSILLISSESWGQNFVSKHHYATYLSLENKVFFLNPAVGFAKFPFGNMQIKNTAISDNLTVLTYRNLLPKLNVLPKFVQRLVYAAQAKRIQKFIDTGLKSIWSFDPNRFMNQEVWTAEKHLYFAMDAHPKSSSELEIAQTSDLILLVSDFLLDKFIHFGSKVHVIGHGADIQNFENPKNEVVLLGKNKLKAGLTGNFNNNVDYNLISEMAVSNPDVDFIFIGPYKFNNLGDSGDKTDRVKGLNQLGNVFFMGSIPSHELQKYLNAFDINLVLYKEENRDINFNPHKLMAYFYAGKVIVSSWLHQYQTANHDLILMANDNEGILKLFSEVKNDLSNWNKVENQKLRRDFSRSNSYEFKIKEIHTLMYGE